MPYSGPEGSLARSHGGFLGFGVEVVAVLVIDFIKGEAMRGLFLFSCDNSRPLDLFDRAKIRFSLSLPRTGFLFHLHRSAEGKAWVKRLLF